MEKEKQIACGDVCGLPRTKQADEGSKTIMTIRRNPNEDQRQANPESKTPAQKAAEEIERYFRDTVNEERQQDIAAIITRHFIGLADRERMIRSALDGEYLERKP